MKQRKVPTRLHDNATSLACRDILHHVCIPDHVFSHSVTVTQKGKLYLVHESGAFGKQKNFLGPQNHISIWHPPRLRSCTNIIWPKKLPNALSVFTFIRLRLVLIAYFACYLIAYIGLAANWTCGGEMALSCSLSKQQMDSSNGWAFFVNPKLARLTTRLGLGGLDPAIAE